MYDLKFGVEMECFGMGQTDFVGTIRAEQTTGEFWATSPFNSVIGFGNKTHVDHFFAVKSDSSIKPVGLEVVSPPLNESELSTVLKPIVQKMIKTGLRCNKTCGLHVHVGVDVPKDESFLDRLYTVWDKKRGQIWRTFRPYRGRNKEYASINFSRDLFKKDRYLGMNNLTGRHKTIEFRLFDGHLDFRYICRAIRFSCEIVADALTS